MKKAEEVKPLDGYRIWLRYADGVEGEIDLSDLAGRGVFEAMERIKPDDWDFFLTVACVFVALTQLNHEGLPTEASIDCWTSSPRQWTTGSRTESPPSTTAKPSMIARSMA